MYCTPWNFSIQFFQQVKWAWGCSILLLEIHRVKSQKGMTLVYLGPFNVCLTQLANKLQPHYFMCCPTLPLVQAMKDLPMWVRGRFCRGFETVSNGVYQEFLRVEDRNMMLFVFEYRSRSRDLQMQIYWLHPRTALPYAQRFYWWDRDGISYGRWVFHFVHQWSLKLGYDLPYEAWVRCKCVLRAISTLAR